MNLNEYQKIAYSTAIYPSLGHPVVYPTLGLAGETGEVAEKIKKLFRDKYGIITEEFKKEITKELGDILWYLAAIATELDLSLEDVAITNLSKLQKRQIENKLHGEGDNR